MSSTIVDEYLETPMEADDAFPCKGCGEVCNTTRTAEHAPGLWLRLTVFAL